MSISEENKDNVPKEKINIRTFKEEDIPQIVELFNTVFGTQGAMLRTVEVFRWRYLECEDFDKNGLIVAEANDKIVSSAVITFKSIKINSQNFFVGAIDDVMTHSEWRKKGLAKAILQKLINYGRTKKIDGILLYTGVNSIAYNFYKKLGFEDINHYTSMVKVTNPKKILKVGDLKTKLFSLWIIVRNALSRFPKPGSANIFELLEIASEEKLKEAFDLFNSYNRQFVGFNEINWNRWLWMNKTLDIAETRIFGVRNKDLKGLAAIAIVTRHKGTFFRHTLNYGILKVAYKTENALSFLLNSLEEVHDRLDIDFFLFSLPVIEENTNLKKVLKAHKFIDFGKLAGTYACLMMKFFNSELKQAVEENKSNPWYIFLEHKLGRP